MGTYAVAVDVGGTFTDIVLCDLESNEQRVFKTPSTPEDPAVGFMTGLARVLADNGVQPSEVVHIFHGTTIATNSVLETKGAPVGLLVTEGFKYVLEIARHGMPRLANPHSWVKPDRPVRPRVCLEVRERTGYDGSPLLPMDEETVRDAADHFRQAGISSVAVSFLHSYANPENERRAREILSEALPGVALSLSSEVLPVYREYERTITTVLNAYVTPRVSVYIENLKNSLDDFGTSTAFSIMKSNGGTIGSETAAKQPVYTALSGPAAGVMATAQIAETTGIENCISFDMGGHQHRRFAAAQPGAGDDPERQAGRLAHTTADAGHRHHRMRRRQHRRGLSLRQSDRRSCQRWSRPRPCLLWQGRNPANGH